MASFPISSEMLDLSFLLRFPSSFLSDSKVLSVTGMSCVSQGCLSHPTSYAVLVMATVTHGANVVQYVLKS
jgi:hypothetical protein